MPFKDIFCTSFFVFLAYPLVPRSPMTNLRFPLILLILLITRLDTFRATSSDLLPIHFLHSTVVPWGCYGRDMGIMGDEESQANLIF